MGVMRVVCVMGKRWVDSAQRARKVGKAKANNTT